MRGRLIYLLLLALICGCREKTALPKTSIHNTAEPYQGFAEPNGRYLYFDSFVQGSRTTRGLYQWAINTNASKKLAEGDNLNIYPSVTRARFYSTSGHTAHQYDSEGTELASIEAPADWDTTEWYCRASDRYLVCAGQLVGMSEESRGYNPLGYTAVDVFDFANKTVHKLKVKLPVYYFFFQPSTAKIFVSDYINENQSINHVTVYSLDGKRIGGFTQRGTSYSPHDRYYIPQLHEGALPFEIYRSSDHKVLLKFNNDKNNQPEFYDYFYGWNPVSDDSIVISREYNESDNSKNTIRVVDVASGNTTFEMKTNEKPLCWNADGKALVFFNDGKFIFQPVQ